VLVSRDPEWSTIHEVKHFPWNWRISYSHKCYRRSVFIWQRSVLCRPRVFLSTWSAMYASRWNSVLNFETSSSNSNSKKWVCSVAWSVSLFIPPRGESSLLPSCSVTRPRLVYVPRSLFCLNMFVFSSERRKILHLRDHTLCVCMKAILEYI
jgi:hypothetical protein